MFHKLISLRYEIKLLTDIFYQQQIEKISVVILYKKLFARVFRNSQKNSGDGSKAANVFLVKLQVLLKLEVVPTSEILLKKRFHCRYFPMNSKMLLRTGFFVKGYTLEHLLLKKSQILPVIHMIIYINSVYNQKS